MAAAAAAGGSTHTSAYVSVQPRTPAYLQALQATQAVTQAVGGLLHALLAQGLIHLQHTCKRRSSWLLLDGSTAVCQGIEHAGYHRRGLPRAELHALAA